MVSLIIYPAEDRFHFSLKFCLDLSFCSWFVFNFIFHVEKREIKKGKIQAKPFCGFFPTFEREEGFKEEEKERRKEGMESQNPSRFGEQNQNDAFQNEHLSFCFILKVFIKKRIQPNQLRLWKLLGSLGNPFYFSWLELYEENCNHVVAVQLPEIYEAC